MKQLLGIIIPDITAPSVAISTPSPGATISGTYNLTATASDDRGVVGVQWKLNGVNIGTEKTVAPYTLSLNTLPYADTSYTLEAVARDAVGHVTTASETIYINNLPAGGDFGPLDWPPASSRHAVDATVRSYAPGYSFPANAYGPYYKIQCRWVVLTDGTGAHGIEGAGSTNWHHYVKLNIGGYDIYTIDRPYDASHAGDFPDTGWFDIGVSGAITFYEWEPQGYETAFTNGMHIQYRYVRL